MHISVTSFSSSIEQQTGYKFTEDQERLINELYLFLYEKKNKKTFVLKGYAGTGKTTILSGLIKFLKKKFTTVVLLAPTGRAAKVLSKYSKHSAFTIHKYIYSQKNQGGNFVFELKKNTLKNAVFIVDECSMIASNSAWGTSKFDRRNLLDDLFQFVHSGKDCSLILSGDTAQLPPVGEPLSKALDLSHLILNYNISEYQYELTQVVRQAHNSSILENATNIRNYIQDNYNANDFLRFKCNQEDVVKPNKSDFYETINDYYLSNVEETLIITRSNKRANQYNQFIRNKIFMRIDKIEAGDLIMAVKNNYFWTSENKNIGFIANGDILRIKRIVKVEEKYGFNFATIDCELVDYEDQPEITLKIWLDSINIEQSSMPREELKKLYEQLEAEYQGESNKRKRIQKVLDNPYFNAVQVKFAYALTCHKSQGGQWKYVFVDPGYFTEDMLNAEYYRWIYTAFTRTTDKLYLLNFATKFFI